MKSNIMLSCIFVLLFPHLYSVSSIGVYNSYKEISYSNGIKALLIHSDRASRAGVSLTVAVGLFNDPENLLGLSEILQQVVTFNFLRCIKTGELYGRLGSITTDEYSNYNFSIPSEMLEETLGNFLAVVTSPSINLEAVNNAINTLDYEFHFSKPNDMQSMKIVTRFLSTGITGRFKCGNKEILEKNLKRRGSNIIEELKHMHERFYSGNNMALVIIDKRQIEELEVMLKGLALENIKSTSILTIKKWHFYANFDTMKSGHIVNIPAKKGPAMVIKFQFPSTYFKYREEVAALLNYYFNYSGEGSFGKFLRDRGLANFTCITLDFNVKNTSFYIEYVLSSHGEANYITIAYYTLIYLNQFVLPWVNMHHSGYVQVESIKI